MNPYALMALAGGVAGAMNALAGGGTFVTLPAMMAVGIPSVIANTSSTVALYPAQLTTAWSYRDGLGPVGTVSIKVLLAATLAGGGFNAPRTLLVSAANTVAVLIHRGVFRQGLRLMSGGDLIPRALCS